MCDPSLGESTSPDPLSLQESGRDIFLKSILGSPVHSVLQRLVPRVRYLETVSPEEG